MRRILTLMLPLAAAYWGFSSSARAAARLSGRTARVPAHLTVGRAGLVKKYKPLADDLLPK